MGASKMNKILLSFLLFCSTSGFAGIKFKTPDYVSLQTGGYTGFATLGLGFKWGAIWDIEGQVGHTPKELAGKDLTTFDLKGRWSPIRYSFGQVLKVGSYLGAGVLYSNSKENFLLLPKQYPDNYYEPSAIKWLFTCGTQIRAHQSFLSNTNVLSSLELFVDYTYTDMELVKYYNNQKYLDFSDLGSYGFGIRKKF